MVLKKIPAEHRPFCEWVAEAAFCNPFTKRRQELYSKIIGKEYVDGDSSGIKSLMDSIQKRIVLLGAERGLDYRVFQTADSNLVRLVVLFAAYHALYEDLDAHILLELASDKGPVVFKSGGKGMDLLQRSGFSEETSAWYVSVFFQIRRAHYFITHQLIGVSPCMQAFKRRLWNNVFTHDIRNYELCMWNRMEEFSILLVGETGTGKEMAASALGRSGFIPYLPAKNRFEVSFRNAFVAANVSQYSPTLLESELFGHRKGSFTGALADYEGLFGGCSQHGAVFLDEIGDVPLQAQIKLLRLLQERTFTQVGGRELVQFRGRVIAAAHPSIDRLLRQEAFRHDFYYRLCSDRIEVPTLRQRIAECPEELTCLANYLLVKLTGRSEEGLFNLVENVLTGFRSHDWPGNVRELEQSVRQILVNEKYVTMREKPDPQEPFDFLLIKLKEGRLTAAQLLQGYARLLYEKHGSYESLSKIMDLDRRTVKKYLNLEIDDFS
jgi:DNA-binding NtrC family response regulator